MKKILIIICLFMFITIVSCKEEEKEFLEIISENTSYHCSGVMETYYMETTKQSSFDCLYKSDDMIKVTLRRLDDDESQIILKNKDGVFILLPSINKSFKLKSDYPLSGSYPYLLNSLAKDIANEENLSITEDEETKTIETKTKMLKDAKAVKQKIIIDKKTSLPKEVLVLDSKDNVYIKVIFDKIEFIDIDDKEFVIEDTFKTIKETLNDVKINRQIRYPKYIPENTKLNQEHTKIYSSDNDYISIMEYTGDDTFTVIQEYLLDTENVQTKYETGNIIHVLGSVGIKKDNMIKVIYEGVEYTVASNTLEEDEMMKIISSYMIEEIEK